MGKKLLFAWMALDDTENFCGRTGCTKVDLLKLSKTMMLYFKNIYNIIDHPFKYDYTLMMNIDCIVLCQNEMASDNCVIAYWQSGVYDYADVNHH